MEIENNTFPLFETIHNPNQIIYDIVIEKFLEAIPNKCITINVFNSNLDTAYAQIILKSINAFDTFPNISRTKYRLTSTMHDNNLYSI